MNLCIVSIKECWQGPEGRWFSYGGFPLQMKAICSLFERTELLVVGSHPREGGLVLPTGARVIALREPVGRRTRRKLSVARNLGYYLSTIRRHIKQADAVYIPLPGDMGLLGMLTALAYRKRLVVRYGGSWSSTGVTTPMNRVTRGLMQLFAGGRNVMLATGDGSSPPARGMHWIFASALSEAELHKINPVLDRGLQSPPRAVYAGRLSPEKGCAVLVQAVARLHAGGFERTPIVTMLGDGVERQRLEALAQEHGCRNRFRFVGQVSRHDLSREMSDADFCIQPSLTEGFSKAWLDAMAHGLPVITSAVGAAPQVVAGEGERGWLTPPGDVDSLSRQIAEVTTAPIDWPELRRRCRGFAETRTLESWVKRIHDHCRDAWQCVSEDGKLKIPRSRETNGQYANNSGSSRKDHPPTGGRLTDC